MSWSKLTLAVFLLIPASWTRVSRLNSAIDLAADTYAKAEYEQSITNHLVLIDEFGYASPELDYNLGLSSQYAEKLEEATGYYDKASIAPNKMLASFAFNQGGVLLGDKKEYEPALRRPRQAGTI